MTLHERHLANISQISKIFGLQFQIEQRKSLQEFRRQREIELAKAENEQIVQGERLMAEANAQAKHAKNTEILQFNDYMHRVRSDREKIHVDRTDWMQVKRANDQLEINAEIERQKKRQLLNAEQRVSGFKHVRISSSPSSTLYRANM